MNNNYTDYLSHHGIKGQRWGVRRYQDEDGSLTDAGKRRYSTSAESNRISRNREPVHYSSNYRHTTGSGSHREETSNSARQRRSINKRRILAGATALAVAGGTAAYLHRHPEQAKRLTELAKNTSKTASQYGIEASKTIGKNSFAVAKKVGPKVGAALYRSGSRAGNAMLDAAFLAAGSIAISKIADRYPDTPDSSEARRNTNKIIREASKAGIESALSDSASRVSTESSREIYSKKNNKKSDGNTNGKKDGSEIVATDRTIKSIVGEPKKAGIDKSSSEYQALYKRSDGQTRPDGERAFIKRMANDGYSISQINTMLRVVDA